MAENNNRDNRNDRNDRTLVSFDWALKSILRQKDNFDILEGFLSTLLDDDITILELLESEGNKDNEQDKINRVDLRTKDSKGREIIIAVQYNREPDYAERVYYGACKSLVENMKEGYWYGKVKKIISVSIVYFGFLKDSYLAKGEMFFKDLNTGKEVTGINKGVFAEYYFIEPNWFDDNVKTKLDEWVYLFKHSKIKDDFKAKNIGKLKDKLAYINMTEAERVSYDAFDLNRAINAGVISEAKTEGRKENSIEIAKKMLAKNKPIDEIIEFTDLTAKEIEEIENN